MLIPLFFCSPKWYLIFGLENRVTFPDSSYSGKTKVGNCRDLLSSFWLKLFSRYTAQCISSNGYKAYNVTINLYSYIVSKSVNPKFFFPSLMLTFFARFLRRWIRWSEGWIISPMKKSCESWICSTWRKEGSKVMLLQLFSI